MVLWVGTTCVPRRPRSHLSRGLLTRSSSRTPYDNASLIVRPCHPVLEESVRLSQAEYKILQQFYHCSAAEQYSVQVSSALTRGYLYAAATPMSIFGSLGVVSAGFKTLVACFSFGDIEGAKILGNMGFEPQGENLSLIMVKAGKAGKRKNTGRYIIETRMDELIKELNIDKNRVSGCNITDAMRR